MIAPKREMNEADLNWLQDALAAITTNERVSVSTGRGGFSLHKPSIVPSAACDFELHGQRRQHIGDERHWRAMRYSIAKILRAENGRLILQDTYGNVLVFGVAAVKGERPYNEQHEKMGIRADHRFFGERRFAGEGESEGGSGASYVGRSPQRPDETRD